MTEVFIITGITCSGKTSMSMELARREGAEIISCDSVQIYRGMDIGSAKASAEEMSEIPHHLVDVCDCDKHFDVSEYVALAKKALEDIAARGKKIIVCGGSGFYLRAWFAAVTDGVGIPSEIKSVCDEIEQRGASALKEALLKIDPAAADTVDILNPRRAKNALARCMASGMTCAELSARFAALPCPMGNIFRKVRIIDLPDSELAPKVRIRTRTMISAGLIEETRRLIGLGIKNNPSASSAIGYRETIDWLERGNSCVSDLEEQIVKDTLGLVKKQRKYFKNSLLKNADNFQLF